MKYILNEIVDLIISEAEQQDYNQLKQALISNLDRMEGAWGVSLKNLMNTKGEQGFTPEVLGIVVSAYNDAPSVGDSIFTPEVGEVIKNLSKVEEDKSIIYEFSDKIEKALRNKAKKTGKSLATIKAVYRRGLAAWKSGHRPGVPQHQWGMGRVNSFLTGKGGARKADADLYRKSKKKSVKEEEKIDPGFEKLKDDILSKKLVFLDPLTDQKIVIKSFDQLAQLLDRFAKADLIMQAVTRPSANEIQIAEAKCEVCEGKLNRGNWPAENQEKGWYVCNKCKTKK